MRGFWGNLRRADGGGRRNDRRRRARTAVGVLTVVAGILLTAAAAFADAADPDVPPAGLHGTVAVDPNTGVRTLTVSGTWTWASHNKSCEPPDRFGVGWAVDWGDSNGNDVGTLAGKLVSVGVKTGTALNAADNTVHYATPSNCTSALNSNGDPIGAWGPISHKYPATQNSFSVCAVMYDLHYDAKNTPPVQSGALVAGGAGNNDDNSVIKGAAVAQGGRGNVCDVVTFTPPSTPTTVKASVAGTTETTAAPAVLGETAEKPAALPRTGSDSHLLIFASGLLLIELGLWAMWLGRRRRPKRAGVST